MIDSTLIRFLLVGLANTAVGFSVVMALQYTAGFEPHWANTGGYIVGWSVSYILNRRFTFQSSRNHRESVPLFMVAALGAYLFNLAVLTLALSVRWMPGPIAQAVAMVSYTLSFYLLSRYVVFAKKER